MKIGLNTDAIGSLELAGYFSPMRGVPAQVYPVFRPTRQADQFLVQLYSGFQGDIQIKSASNADLNMEHFPEKLSFPLSYEDFKSKPIICLRLSRNRFEIGPISEIKHSLRRLLNQHFFDANPFLGVEVARAAEAPSRELYFAKLCTEKLVDRSVGFARDWIRHAKLNPDSELSVVRHLTEIVENKKHFTPPMGVDEKRDEVWARLERAFEFDEKVEGAILNQVKGGYTVDLGGVVAFLPRSQVDIRPVRDIGPLMTTPQPFQILKMDKLRNNIVVSRRAIVAENRAEQRQGLGDELAEGMAIDGVVKNITDYGAFVDLGGIDGLLHVTDVAWRRINHPSEVLSIGQTVKVQIIKINQDTQRISLGMKQLEADPWDGIDAKYPLGVKLSGRVTNITDYGAFVELEPGIEGLIHVSEMSWVKKNVHPGKIVSTSQEVDVVVLEVDPSKRRISLGLKQTMANPWEAFSETFPVGTEVEGEVKNKTEFGLFIGLEGDIDGMVHLSDLDWNRSGEEAIEDFNKGDTVRAVVLDVDVEKERISLGIKQLGGNPFAAATDEIKRGAIVTCEIIEVKDGGLDVKLADTDVKAFIRRTDLSKERSEQRTERFAVGEKVDARITQFDPKTRRVSVSIKALEVAEEKELLKIYGTSDAGATLGDVFKVAIDRKYER